MSAEMLASLVAAVAAILAFLASCISAWMTYQLKNVERRDSYSDRVGRAIGRAELVEKNLGRLMILMDAAKVSSSSRGNNLYLTCVNLTHEVTRLRGKLDDPDGEIQKALDARAPKARDLVRIATIEESLSHWLTWAKDVETLIVPSGGQFLLDGAV